MANDLSTLAPTLYRAAKDVAAEPFGIIDAISADFDDGAVAVGDTVDVPVAPARAAKDFTPGNVTSTGDDATADDIPVQITKSRKVDWHLTGEQLKRLENGGTDQDWIRQLVAQGMRTLRNEAERDCAIAIKQGSSRAVGAAGTTPFASDINLIAEARKVLADNGAPLSDLQFVVDTSAGLNLRKLGIIQQADQAGSDEERRSGRLMRQFGFRIAESAGVGLHTKGTAASYLVNDAGLVAGDRTIAYDGAGSGSFVAGDVVTFAGDTTNYIAGAASTATPLVLNRPGLDGVVADNAAITVGNNYTANLAFERNAVVGIMRPPMMPVNPTIQQLTVSDQFGMTYLFLDIAQYGQRTWELHLAWGFKAINSEFIATVMG